MLDGKRLARRRAELGLEQIDVAKRANVSQSTVSRVERDVAGDLGMATLEALARGYGLSLDALLALRRPAPSGVVMVPLYAVRIQASGKPVDEVVGAVPVGARYRGRDLAAFVVSGNCMTPRIEDGDTVIVEQATEWEAGRLTAVMHEGALLCKRPRRNGSGWWLESDNDPPIRVTAETFCRGTVVGVFKVMEG